MEPLHPVLARGAPMERPGPGKPLTSFALTRMVSCSPLWFLPRGKTTSQMVEKVAVHQQGDHSHTCPLPHITPVHAHTPSGSPPLISPSSRVSYPPLGRSGAAGAWRAVASSGRQLAPRTTRSSGPTSYSRSPPAPACQPAPPRTSRASLLWGSGFRVKGLQGYLAHKKPPAP